MSYVLLYLVVCFFFFSSRRRHTRCALVTGVQTCALPILAPPTCRGGGKDWAIPVSTLLSRTLSGATSMWRPPRRGSGRRGRCAARQVAASFPLWALAAPEHEIGRAHV